jgi:diguanylate cyclase (GGDEF)-like protein
MGPLTPRGNEPWYRNHVSQRPKASSGKVLKTLPAVDASPTLSQAVVQAVKAPHRPVLVVISGNEMGMRRRIEQSMLIGRDPDCDLVLTDGLVSSRHALLEDRGDSWTLIDLGSTNGTSVNGKKGKEFVLERNDKVVFGRTVARFEMQDSLEQAYDELVEKLLNVDDLSGLLVRRKFDAELNVAIEIARAKAKPLGLLMMDLDGIKKINDTHGHLFGAYVIGESGRVIGRVLESKGFASRFGGDEYVAAIPGVDLTGACAFGEEIRRAIGEHKFERDGVSLHPGISIGVGAFPENATDMNRLFQHADEALYRAKRAGKNQVSC